MVRGGVLPLTRDQDVLKMLSLRCLLGTRAGEKFVRSGVVRKFDVLVRSVLYLPSFSHEIFAI